MSKEVKPDFEKALYNEIRPYDKIIEEVFSNDMSSTYILQSRKELLSASWKVSLSASKKALIPQNLKML